jgi:valyl-tRNA synthetase
MSSGGRDIKMSKARVEGYRNFGTKLWNAARFCQMNDCRLVPGFDPAGVDQTINRWIRGEAARTAAAVTAALDACAFDDAAEALYRFIWNTFCDWYLELAKPILGGSDEAARAETRATAAWALDQACLLLHPISPFLTEELWGRLAEAAGIQRPSMLITAPWPELPESYVDVEAAAEIDWLIALVTEVRSIRSEMNVPPSARPALSLTEAGSATRERLTRHRELLLSLARLGAAEAADAAPQGAVPFVLGEATGALAIAEFIDVAAERARLQKAIAAEEGEAAKVRRKLDSADFVSRAPAEVVEENRTRLADAGAAAAKLRAALSRLQSLG